MVRKILLFALGCALILFGAWLANRIQTSGGVTVSEARFPAGDKVTVSGLLYMPATATAQDPAPAVLVSHGYINTREMQSPFAIELARRGFVVLAMDMTGHGYSQGSVGSHDFGGPAALRYLQSLPQVDKANIGMEGHSMGGGPILAAAVDQPDGYRSIVLEGGTLGLMGSKAPANPRNIAVVFGQYDEFSGLMWGVPKGSDIGASKKLQALFGVSETVEPRRVYGSVAEGTARVLFNPPITHPWEHFSSGGVAPAVYWFQQTLNGAAAPRVADDQIWIWKEVGTLIAFAGFVVLLLGTFQLLLATPLFAGLSRAAEPANERRDGRWWLVFALTAAVPAATYFPFMKLGQVFFPMQLFPQWVHNQLLAWALLNGLITLGLGFLLKTAKPRFTTRWAPQIALGLATVAVGYLSLVVVDAVFKVDYRIWVLGLKPLDAAHAVIMLPYLVLWTAFFLITVRALTANLSVKGEGEIVQLTAAKLAMSLGFLVLVAVEYVVLFQTGFLATPKEPLNTIVAIQFIPLLALVGVLSAFTYRRTNSFVPGAVICGVLISWYITAGTAIHWSPDFRLPQPAAASTK
jgi:pimeloyl-ACP methyl ester carboxylesterase